MLIFACVRALCGACMGVMNGVCDAICTQTAQVKGSAATMVAVVTTQELQPGDLLRRFKAQAAQDEPRRGNNDKRGLVALGTRKLLLCMVFLSLACWCLVHACVCNCLCSFSCDVGYVVQCNTTCLLTELEMCTMFALLGTPRMSAPTPTPKRTAPQTHKNINSSPSCQCSRRSLGMSSNALSMTALEFRQRAIAHRGCMDRLANGMCPTSRTWVICSMK